MHHCLNVAGRIAETVARGRAPIYYAVSFSGPCCPLPSASFIPSIIPIGALPVGRLPIFWASQMQTLQQQVQSGVRAFLDVVLSAGSAGITVDAAYLAVKASTGACSTTVPVVGQMPCAGRNRAY
jgi:hypothetical protein